MNVERPRHADVLERCASSRRCSRSTVRFVLPPRAGGWIDTFATGAQRTDIENLITRTASVTWRAGARSNERRTPAFGVGFYDDDQEPFGLPTESSHALYVDGEYTWRNVDNLLDPTQGMDGERAGRATAFPGASTEQFGRVIGQGDGMVAALAQGRSPRARRSRRGDRRFARGHPVGVPVPHRRRHHGARLRVREPRRAAGQRDRRRPLLRGRERRGRPLDHAVVGHGRVRRCRQRRSTRFPSFDLAVGYGLGARLRTPIGPFRLDVAYGQEDHKVRVHFSVGLAF